MPRLHFGTNILALHHGTPCGEIESRFSWNYSAIASSSSCQLGHNFSDPAQDLVLSGRRLFGTMDAMNPPRWFSLSALPEKRQHVGYHASASYGYKACTPFSRYRLPPTHCRFLVSHSISVSIHSLICSAISQWLFAHSPCSSLSYLPRNPLLLLNPLQPHMPSAFMEPAHHPTALPRR